MENPNTEQVLKSIVERYFKIDDVIFGGEKESFLFRFHGNLRTDDSINAYSAMEEQLRPFEITPLFRKDGGRQMVVLIKGIHKPPGSNSRVNLILFILTVLCVLLTGALTSLEDPLPEDFLEMIQHIYHLGWPFLLNGWPFAVSMMAILSAHEFGHYFVGRYHNVKLTLPYFIPLPFSPFGTMGAVINMKEPPVNKRQLLDIGIAGPLSGLVVTIPVLLIGLRLSTLDTIQKVSEGTQGLMMEGNSLLYLLLKFITFGKLLPQPESFNGWDPFIYWVRYFFTGQPFPFGGLDVMIHPVAWAGWAGLLITGLNLIPAGQLDGGHMVYVLFGREKASKLRPFILGGLLLMGMVWSGWWLWAVIIYFFGKYYAEPRDQITELDGKRKIMAVAALLIFVFVITPVPLIFM
jgi:Zn-dependent protease